MQNIADDGHAKGMEALLVMTDGEKIEQALGGMRMPTVACIDDMDIRPIAARKMLRDQVRCAALRMPHDEHVRVHGNEVVDGVEEAFTLARRRHADVEVDDVGRKSLRCDFEGGAGA